MLEKAFKNEELGIELTSYIDKQQNVFFLGKDVTKILGYKDSVNALKRHVSEENKMLRFMQVKFMGGDSPPKQNDRGRVSRPQQNDRGRVSPPKQNDNRGRETRLQQNNSGGETPPKQNDNRGKYYTIINEPGFYELVFGSKLEFAKKFRQWVFNIVLPSIRKYGQYKMFDSPWNKMIMISNEKELHFKVVNLIRNFYPDSILVAGLGENQDTEEKRLDSYKKGYGRGQPDLIVLNYHNYYRGLCIEFKSPTNNYEVSESQLKMKDKYIKNNYAFILSNDYDKISKLVHKYMAGVRIPCEYCTKAFRKIKTLNSHYRVIHRIKKIYIISK